MSDLRTQLRRYLEETSVPVDVAEMLSSQTDVLHSVRPSYRWGLPRWAVGLAAALAVVLVVGGTALGIWLFAGSSNREVVQPGPSPTLVPTATTPELKWCFNPDCVEPVESGEVIRVSTVLGEMEWQRLVGPEFEVELSALNRSLAESAIPFGAEGVDWGSVGWPLADWGVETRLYREPTGLPLPGLAVGVVDASGVWEPLDVEADETWDHGEERPMEEYWFVAGPAGVMLIGDPWSSTAAPVGWVMSDEGRFELVGSLPFQPGFVWPDHVPMVFPVADGFVGIGHRGPGEVLSPRPGQDLWWSEDGRTWTLLEERPFGEDGELHVLAEYGGQWIGLQTGAWPNGAWTNWVWASTDGRGWDRVGELPVQECWGAPALLGGERGWIAVNCDFSTVWLSADGTEWQQLPNQDTILGIYLSRDEGSLSMPVSLIGKDRTVLISADWGWWDTSVGWLGRFTEDPPSP